MTAAVAHPVGAGHPTDVPQTDLCVIAATQQPTRQEGAPGQPVALSLVTCRGTSVACRQRLLREHLPAYRTQSQLP